MQNAEGLDLKGFVGGGGGRGVERIVQIMINLLVRFHQRSTQSYKIWDNQTSQKQKLRDKNFTFTLYKIKSYKF